MSTQSSDATLATFKRFCKFFTSRLIQGVVQSRLGQKTATECSVTADTSDWFNVRVPELGEVTSEIRTALQQRFPPVASCVTLDFTVRTAEGELLPVESWTISVNDELCDVTVSLEGQLYHQLGQLLKSTFAASRVTPTYRHYARRQGIDSFIICYNIYEGRPDLSQLGDGYRTLQIGNLPSPHGALNVHLYCRTKMVISTGEQRRLRAHTAPATPANWGHFDGVVVPPASSSKRQTTPPKPVDPRFDRFDMPSMESSSAAVSDASPVGMLRKSSQSSIQNSPVENTFSTSPGQLSFDYAPLGNPLIDQTSSLRRSLRHRTPSSSSGHLGLQGQIGGSVGRGAQQRIVIPLDLQAFDQGMEAEKGRLMLRHSPHNTSHTDSSSDSLQFQQPTGGLTVDLGDDPRRNRASSGQPISVSQALGQPIGGASTSSSGTSRRTGSSGCMFRMDGGTANVSTDSSRHGHTASSYNPTLPTYTEQMSRFPTGSVHGRLSSSQSAPQPLHQLPNISQSVMLPSTRGETHNMNIRKHSYAPDIFTLHSEELAEVDDSAFADDPDDEDDIDPDAQGVQSAFGAMTMDTSPQSEAGEVTSPSKQREQLSRLVQQCKYAPSNLRSFELPLSIDLPSTGEAEGETEEVILQSPTDHMPERLEHFEQQATQFDDFLNRLNRESEERME